MKPHSSSLRTRAFGIVGVIAFLLAIDVHSQNLDQALRWSPDGVYTLLGSLFAREGKTRVEAVIIQRDDGGGYRDVARVQRPASREMFERVAGETVLAEIRRAKNLLDDNAAWEYVRNHGDLAEYGMLAFNLRFLRALGAAFLDEEVKHRQAGTKLSYRLLVVRGGATEKDGPKGILVAGMPPSFPAPRLSGSNVLDSSFQALWVIRPAVEGPMWADVYMQRGGRGLFEKLNARIVAGRDGDSVLFGVNVNAEPENLYRLFIRPLDFVGNPAATSDTLTLLSVNPNRFPVLESISCIDTTNGILLRWRALQPKPWYTAIEISRSKEPEKNYSRIATIPATSSEYLDPSVLPDKVYYYRLSIVTATGAVTKLAGSISSAHRNTSTAPLAPNGLSAEAEGKGVRLRWLPVVTNDLFAYFVYRGASLSDSMQQISPALKETSFLDTATTLSGRLSYVYTVRAVNSDQTMSEPSIAAFAKPLRPSPPSAVLGLAAFHSGARVQLSWPDMTRTDGGIAEYRVYRRKADPKAPSYSEHHATAEGKRSAKELGFELLATTREPHYDDNTPLTADALYTVSCVDITGAEGPVSNPAKASAPRATIAPPSFLGARAIPSGIELLWHRVPDASVSGYALYRRLPNQDTPARISTASKSASSFVDASAKAGVLYFYSVAAITPAGETPRSREKGAQR